MNDLADTSAAEVRRLIAARDVSVCDVVGACLARVERLGPTLNAIVTLNPRAMDDAMALDARLARGDDPGLLTGLTAGIKDVTPVAGPSELSPLTQPAAGRTLPHGNLPHPCGLGTRRHANSPRSAVRSGG